MSAASLFAACTSGSDGNKAVRQFAIDFATKVSQNQLDSVKAIYADAEKADSLALNFIADSVTVTATEAPGTFLATFTQGADATITQDEDGTMRATTSHGLFAYPADVLTFAQKTGQYKAALSDVENASRMADKDFKSRLIKQHIQNAAKKLKVVGQSKVVKEPEMMMDTGILAYTVQSTSEQPISGSDYEVFFKVLYVREMNSYIEKKAGQDLPPHGSATFTIEFTGYCDVERAWVNTTLSEEAHFNKYFQATGNEYDEYMKSK